MLRQNCHILENKKIAPGHWVMKLRCKAIAQIAKPGQFIQILCTDESFDPLLPRPFSFLDIQTDTISILYQVVGKGTTLLSKKNKGESLRVLGPLGNGFILKTEASSQKNATRVLVGGGVGIPPLYHLAKNWILNKHDKKNIHVFLGARDKSLLLCEKEFAKLGVQLHVATDNGSKGHNGFVTEILDKFLVKAVPPPSPRLAAPGKDNTPRLYTCGPTPMLKAVSAMSAKYKVSCEVSVEVPMACGFGACLGCALKVKTDKNEHRFAIACTEGPVFHASEIVWE